jgi:glycosyltransferase involved in cell wall biosynthesis
MPLVSIILPTRDRADLLPRAVASVIGQTMPEFELLVVDSSPASAAVPSAIPGSDARIRIVLAPDARNAAAARNAGLAIARGEWIAFLDDDDAYRPRKLETQLAAVRRTGAPLVFCGALVHLLGRKRQRHTDTERLAGDELLYHASFATPLILHRRSQTVRFDESLSAGEDMHYLQQLLAAFSLSTVTVVPEPLVDIYQDVPTRARTNLRADAGWRAARRVWWEFGGRYSREARRLFIVRALIARAKLHRSPARVVGLVPPLLRAGGVKQLRYALNAVAVASGWMRGRWVT